MQNSILSPIKIAVVDDHSVVRHGIIQIINKQIGTYEVILEAGNGDELIDRLPLLGENQPDFVITDISMPLKDGFETVSWLKKHHPGIKVLVLTMFDDANSVLRMIKLGVDGFISKNANTPEILLALRSIRDKGHFYSELVIDNIVESMNNVDSHQSPHDIWSSLSEIEKELVKYAFTEMTYKEIAGEMGLTVKSIDGYRDNVFNRFNVKSRIGMVMYALKNNLVTP